ncbi:hypothetical protein ACTL6U_17050 [Rhodovibrionaceae bacterium A322]
MKRMSIYLTLGIVAALLAGGFLVAEAHRQEDVSPAVEPEVECNSCTAKHQLRRLKPKASED